MNSLGYGVPFLCYFGFSVKTLYSLPFNIHFSAYQMRSFSAILFLTWFLNLFLPWWSVLLPALVIGMWLLNGAFKAFFTGLAAGGAAWLIQALYVHIANDGILAGRIAEVMQVGSPLLVLLFTFVIGGILSGTGTLVGYHFRSILRPVSPGSKA